MLQCGNTVLNQLAQILCNADNLELIAMDLCTFQ